jgi:hypothetical protein
LKPLPLSNACEFLKVLIELGAALAPLLTVRFFSFVNPKIIDEVWGTTILVALVAGFVVYFLSRPTTARPNPRILGILAAGLCLFSLSALLALTGEVLRVDPHLASYLARLFFIGFFAGFSGVLSWVAARLLYLANPH